MLVVAAALALAAAGCGEKGEPATTGPVVAQTTTPTVSSTTETGTGTSTTSTTTAPDDVGQSDQKLVSTAVTRFLSSADPSVCSAGITQALLQRAYRDRSGCVAARRPARLASGVRIGAVQIGQGTATVAARAKGGAYGSGKALKLSLVRDGVGTWRVDAVRSSASSGP